MTSKRPLAFGRAQVCLAVAALLPMSATASTSVPAGPAATELAAVLTSSADAPAERDDSSATATGREAYHATSREATRTAATEPAPKRRAVIRTTASERVAAISANTTYDVPQAALEAYRHAARALAASNPSCSLSWGVVAAIGKVESDHGRFGGAAVLADGLTSPRIVGMALNGHGVAQIGDSDNGRLDGDRVWDRAVGPMQFIPTTWASLARDGDGDGERNPSDFDDAALTTATYLCSGGADFRVLSQARGAVLRYNHSEEYVDLVLTIANAYDSGVVDVVPNDRRPTRQPKARAKQASAKPAQGTPDGTRHHARDRRPTSHPPRPAESQLTTTQPSRSPSPSPTRASSSPAPTPAPKPAPTASPSPTPTPAPSPAPAPKPTLRLAGGSYYLGDARLDLGSGDLAAPYGDYDRDGHAEALRDELSALLGVAVPVTTTAGRVTSINGVAYDPTAPILQPTTTSPTATVTSLATSPSTPIASSPNP